jgi:hypothetical protein
LGRYQAVVGLPGRLFLSKQGLIGFDVMTFLIFAKNCDFDSKCCFLMANINHNIVFFLNCQFLSNVGEDRQIIDDNISPPPTPIVAQVLGGGLLHRRRDLRRQTVGQLVPGHQHSGL